MDRQIGAAAAMILVTRSELRVKLKLKLKTQVARKTFRVSPNGRKPLGRTAAENATTASHFQIL